MLTIFKLTRLTRVGYDEVVEFIITAMSEDEARRMAADEAGDEGHYIWVDPMVSGCYRLGRADLDTPRVECRSFNAG